MKKLLLLLFIIPSISYCQGNDPETILRNKEAEKAERDEKDKLKDTAYIFNFPKDASGNISYSDVVKVENVLGQDLYSRAKLFVAEAYKSTKDVTQLNDDAAKVILIKPLIKAYAFDAWSGGFDIYTNYQLKIECKDGRYRYTIDGLNFSHTIKLSKYGPFPFEYKYLRSIMTKKSALQVQKDVDLQIRAIISLLAKQMTIAIADF